MVMVMANKASSLQGKIRGDLFFGTSPDLPKIIELDLAKIRQNPDQPRKTFNETALNELAESISKHRLIQPITVKSEDQGTYLLVAGERRFRAFQILGQETIPAIVTEGNVDEIALIENIQREDLNPLDTAEALQQMMMRYHYTQEELGKIIGKAQNTISEFLKVNLLPQIIKDEYRILDLATTINKSVLIEITRLNSEEDQLAFWNIAKQGNFTVRQLRARKRPPDSQDPMSKSAQSIKAGKKFIRMLENLKNNTIFMETDREELIVIRERIISIIDQLTESSS